MYLSYEIDTFSQYGLLDDDFEEKRRAHLENILNELGLSEHDRKSLLDLIKSYFPELQNTFRGPTGATHGYERELNRQRRIGHRDYLFRYFMFNESIEDKHEVENKVKSLLMKKYLPASEENRVQVLSSYFKKLKPDQADLHYIAALDLVYKKPELSELNLTFYRDLLRTYLQTTDYVIRDESRALHQIMATIDRTVASHSELDPILAEVDKYMSHPSSGLRLLLYMHPTRDNIWFHFRNYSKYQELKDNILNFVDNFYLDQGADVFDEDKSDSREWRFILFQWALSISNLTEEPINETRRSKVNNYILGKINSDAQKLHKFIVGVFWQMDPFTDKFSFHLDKKPQPYDIDKVASAVRAAIGEASTSLSVEQISDLKSFLEAYDTFTSSQSQTIEGEEAEEDTEGS